MCNASTMFLSTYSVCMCDFLHCIDSIPISGFFGAMVQFLSLYPMHVYVCAIFSVAIVQFSSLCFLQCNSAIQITVYLSTVQCMHLYVCVIFSVAKMPCQALCPCSQYYVCMCMYLRFSLVQWCKSNHCFFCVMVQFQTLFPCSLYYLCMCMYLQFPPMQWCNANHCGFFGAMVQFLLLCFMYVYVCEICSGAMAQFQALSFSLVQWWKS